MKVTKTNRTTSWTIKPKYLGIGPNPLIYKAKRGRKPKMEENNCDDIDCPIKNYQNDQLIAAIEEIINDGKNPDTILVLILDSKLRRTSTTLLDLGLLRSNIHIVEYKYDVAQDHAKHGFTVFNMTVLEYTEKCIIKYNYIHLDTESNSASTLLMLSSIIQNEIFYKKCIMFTNCSARCCSINRKGYRHLGIDKYLGKKIKFKVTIDKYNEKMMTYMNSVNITGIVNIKKLLPQERTIRRNISKKNGKACSGGTCMVQDWYMFN